MLARLSLFALLFLSAAYCTVSIATEGGNVSCVNLSQPTPTQYWAGIAGWMNTSVSPDLAYPVLIHFPFNSSIYTVYPNGSVSNYTMIASLLSSKPDIPSLSSPAASDFNSTGMFSNFSLFLGTDFTTFLDSPYNTFANPFATLPCTVGNTTFSCAYVFLAQNSFLGVLKYSDATHSEPVFLSSIDPRAGYNGSMFDVQFMLPANETYFFYIYEEEAITAILYSPTSTTYSDSTILVNYSASPDSALDSCWYSLDGANYSLSNCTGNFNLTLADGTYTLTFYANSTTGRTASDSATFTIATAPEDEEGTDLKDEELPIEPFPGYEFPEVYPGANFTVAPDSIGLYAIYLSPTESNFTVSSSVALTNVACVMEADFIEYVSISLESREIGENGTILGHIRVNMPLSAILEYSENGPSFADSFYCTGTIAGNTARIASARSEVVLEAVPPQASINLPNETGVLFIDGRIQINITLANTGNTSLRNLTINATGPEMMQVILPHFIGELPPGASRTVPVYVVVGDGVPLPSTASFLFSLFEDGFELDESLLELDLKAPGFLPPGWFAAEACTFPILFPLYTIPETPPQWMFLLMMSLATWSLLHRFKRLSRKKRIAIAALPLVLALPGQWIFNPCTMMNLAVAEFAFLALYDAAREIRRRLWLRKKKKEILEKSKKGEPEEGRKEKGQQRQGRQTRLTDEDGENVIPEGERARGEKGGDNEKVKPHENSEAREQPEKSILPQKREEPENEKGKGPTP
ncbi:hypothetical protein JW721_05195 [Candidatus Micrarchaeota archaeon]|nr:hypothetical protein [Candidatus Micrarchaeota archaeon]